MTQDVEEKKRTHFDCSEGSGFVGIIEKSCRNATKRLNQENQ
jgi:hypothetical protein